jgi:hypothetical protein
MNPVTLFTLILCLSVSARAEEGASEKDVRRAIERGLPFIEKEGVAWMNDRGCVTCHQTTFLVWTHHEAARRGLATDARKLNEWNTWALLKVLAGEDGSTPQAADTLAQMLLSRSERGALTAKPRQWTRTTDPYENVLKHLLGEQTAAGHWVAGGQSEYPPDVPTGWTLLALAERDRLMKLEDAAVNPGKNANAGLQTLIKANDEGLSRSRERGLAWLKTVKEDTARDLNEQLVVRLLVEKIHGTAERTQQRRQDLLGRQNADGGWSYHPVLGKGSDAFATGQSLYALARAGTNPGDSALAKARAFLLQTQQSDGSWLVPTSAIHELSGKAARDAKTDGIYQYWGTAWAVLGLLETLPMPVEAAAAVVR